MSVVLIKGEFWILVQGHGDFCIIFGFLQDPRSLHLEVRQNLDSPLSSQIQTVLLMQPPLCCSAVVKCVSVTYHQIVTAIRDQFLGTGFPSECILILPVRQMVNLLLLQMLELTGHSHAAVWVYRLQVLRQCEVYSFYSIQKEICLKSVCVNLLLFIKSS